MIYHIYILSDDIFEFQNHIAVLLHEIDFVMTDSVGLKWNDTLLHSTRVSALWCWLCCRLFNVWCCFYCVWGSLWCYIFLYCSFALSGVTVVLLSKGVMHVYHFLNQNCLNQFPEISWNKTSDLHRKLLWYVTLTLHDVTLTSQQPCQLNIKRNCSKTNGNNWSLCFFQ